MRLFVAVRLPEEVLDQVGEVAATLRDHLGGDDGTRLRWSTREQWHVTLRFLGEVADPDEVVKALAGGTGHEGDPCPAGVEAWLGSRPQVLGGSVLCLPVHGLDELAGAVSEATAHIGQPPDPRPFRGHVTLARPRGRQRRRLRLGDVKGPRLDGLVELRWRVREVHVMRSHLRRDGSLYETLSTTSLGLGPTSSGGPDRAFQQ